MDSRRFPRLANVVENAVQHSPRGGVVSVTAEVEDTRASGCCSAPCRTAGRASATEDLPHVFEPFFSSAAAAPAWACPSSQRIVEEHGGRIERRATTRRAARW